MHRQQPNLLIEIGNAVTHGLGVGLSIVGMIALIITAVNAHSPLKLVAFIIYGTVLVLFYLASTLFHSLIFTRARHVFQVFDHSMIYLLIAGSYIMLFSRQESSAVSTTCFACSIRSSDSLTYTKPLETISGPARTTLL